jgi:hypothetical protein
MKNHAQFRFWLTRLANAGYTVEGSEAAAQSVYTTMARA